MLPEPKFPPVIRIDDIEAGVREDYFERESLGTPKFMQANRAQ